MNESPRCSRHKEVKITPRGCDTCRRIGVEREVVETVVCKMLAKEYWLNVDNGGDDEELAKPSNDADVILKEMMETDEDRLYVYRNNVCIGWVFFVYGNDGWDVINDYTTNLSEVMDPISEWCGNQLD